MAGVVPLFDEVREHCLEQVGRVNIHCESCRSKSIHQIGGDDHISDAQRWVKALTESAYVNDTRIAIQPLKRGNWRAFIAVLAVIIVLDDPCSDLLSPLE